jgi:hypothetical protein
MANVNSPDGFQAYCYKDGKGYTGQARTYYKAVTSAPIFVGDPVIRITSTDPNGYPAIDRATTGAAVTGHVVGIKLKPDDLTFRKYLSAGETGYMMVCDDPNVLLLVQEGGSGTQLALAQIGKHIDAVAAVDGNTYTQNSNYQVDNNAVATGNTYRIEAMAEAVMVGNELGQYQKVLVAVNLSTEVNAGASTLSETA